jgi:uncharacterized protein DUF4244
MSTARLSSPRLHARLRSRVIAAASTAVSAISRVIDARLRTADDVGTPTAGAPTVGMSTAGIPTVGMSTAGIPTVGMSTAGTPTVGMSTAGMSTAEYAIGTVAACALAALLYKVVTSTQILDLLTGVVSRALHVPF